MANKFDNGTTGIAINPFVLDTVWTAGTIPAALTALKNAGRHSFKRIAWIGATTAGHVCEFQDINGNVLCSATASTTPNAEIDLWNDAMQPITFKQSQWVLATLGSGKVLLYK